MPSKCFTMIISSSDGYKDYAVFSLGSLQEEIKELEDTLENLKTAGEAEEDSEKIRLKRDSVFSRVCFKNVVIINFQCLFELSVSGVAKTQYIKFFSFLRAQSPFFRI